MNPNEYLAVEPEKVMSQHAKTFSFAATVLSPAQLAPVARLYQVCRVIDDCADELPPVEARTWLDSFRQAVSSHDGAFGRAVQLVESRGVEKRHLLALIAGAQFDLDMKPIRSADDLLHYCYLVAGVVGMMMCPLLGVRKMEAGPYARDLGIAMQLTNICRDVHTDATLGRIYLPELKSGVTEIADASLTPRDVKVSIRAWLAEADRFYESAYRGLAFLPLRARFCILIAGQVYRAIGKKISEGGYDVHSERVFLSRFEKISVATKAVVRILRPSFWLKPELRKPLRADAWLLTVEAKYK